jgi:hypothetical protein
MPLKHILGQLCLYYYYYYYYYHHHHHHHPSVKGSEYIDFPNYKFSVIGKVLGTVDIFKNNYIAQ